MPRLCLLVHLFMNIYMLYSTFHYLIKFCSVNKTFLWYFLFFLLGLFVFCCWFCLCVFICLFLFCFLVCLCVVFLWGGGVNISHLDSNWDTSLSHSVPVFYKINVCKIKSYQRWATIPTYVFYTMEGYFGSGKKQTYTALLPHDKFRSSSLPYEPYKIILKHPFHVKYVTTDYRLSTHTNDCQIPTEFTW